MATNSTNTSDKPTVKSLISETKYIGLIGSDTLLNLINDKKKTSVFMKGIKVPDKYQENTIGGIIAIPVESFIVALREKDSIQVQEFSGKPIIKIIKTNQLNNSSTKIRLLIKENQSINNLISDEILKVINCNKLYIN